MLVLAIKPGHDGSVAVIKDRVLQYSLEGEKDTFPRYSSVTPMALLQIAERLDAVPDIVALGGWAKPKSMGPIEVGYFGVDALRTRNMNFFGRQVEFFTSSHERSHIMMAAGMAPPTTDEFQTVLVWEGVVGGFYLLNNRAEVVREVPVLTQPGERYSFLFSLADPTFRGGQVSRPDGAGKLMALAAYGNPNDADPEIVKVVDDIMAADSVMPPPKQRFRDSPLYNAGVESEACKTAAALLTQRIFDRYLAAAREHLPAGTRLLISGGCGLNCDWNAAWRDVDHFNSVFVPPCTNDSGSAIGTAIDAIAQRTGDPYIEWDVYTGLEFERDTEPDPACWTRRPLDDNAVAKAIADGAVIAWVQGRWEIGPRALGHRSLLAEPFHARTKERLNEIKKREDYRPIAPVCRVEDIPSAFKESFEDPYMLYFRHVRAPELGAVTHVDGSARAQTVRERANPELHRLLTSFAELTGIGVMCNTSLNFNGFGFINTMSDLTRYCEERGVDAMVVGTDWFVRR
jgi:hydroxymethyl cephem carbamoyltransferase